MDQGGDQNLGGAAPERQGIFTPQPQPDTANTMPNTTPPAVNTTGSLTGQPLTFNSADTGDIILNNGTPGGNGDKMSKKPLIIGGIVLAVVVVVCGILLAVAGGNNSGGGANQAPSKASVDEVKQAFSAFSSYIEYGPDAGENSEARSDDEEWFIEQMAGYLYGSDEKNAMATIVNERFEDFKTKFAVSKFGSNADLSKVVDTESTLIQLVLAYINLEGVIHPVISQQLNGASNSDITNAINAILPPETGIDLLDSFRANIVKYIQVTLKMYSLYSRNNCVLEDGNVSLACASNLRNNGSLGQLETEREPIAKTLEGYFESTIPELKGCTLYLQEQLNAQS